MKSIVALTVVTCLSFVSAKKTAPHAVFVKNQEDLQEDKTFYYMQGVRGTWLGLEHGLFKTKEGETCLDDDTAKRMLKIIEAIEVKDFVKIQKSIPDMMAIYSNLMECHTIQEVRNLENFCAEDMAKCSPSVIMANVQKNMFAIMGKLTDMSSIIQEFPAETPDDLYTQTYTIGDDIGTIVRSILGFDEKPKKEDKKDKKDEKKDKKDDKKGPKFLH
jgi:hypothetical protein